MSFSLEDFDNLDFFEVVESTAQSIPLVSPGQILLEEFLQPLDITAAGLAKSIGVSRRTIAQIILGKRAITVDVGLRLSYFFGLSDGYFTRLQLDYDIERSKQSLVDVLPAIIPFKANNRPVL